MRVLFRTDASLEIGTGHVMRCLALADVLRLHGADCVFVCRDHAGHLGDLIQERGHQVHLLSLSKRQVLDAYDHPAHLAWLGADWEVDAGETAAIAQGSVDLLVVDHYALDSRWERALRPHCNRILVIDDLADREHECDFLLDQNLISDMRKRYSGKVPANCALMLGPNYALLQPQYARLSERLPLREGKVCRVLIYFGGADASNLTGMAVSACLALAKYSFHVDVVANSKGPHIEALRKQIRGHEHIVLHENLPSLAALMAKADLAIGAAGTTSWERCCLGLPSLVITLADNQKPIAKELNRQGLIQWLGHKDKVSERRLIAALKPLLARGISAAWSRQCYALVDGKGAERVGELLRDFAPVVRAATRQDEAMLGIEIATWFGPALRDLSGSHTYLAETSSGALLGCVFFQGVQGCWQAASGFTSIAVEPALRGAVMLDALRKLRADVDGSMSFAAGWNGATLAGLAPAVSAGKADRSLSIVVCSQKGSWINEAIPELIMDWLAAGHRVSWSHAAKEAPAGDLCFFLSYGRIVGSDVRIKYAHNLVVHASDLPKGRGWSPMSWQILEGATSIPVTLIEAADEVDAGDIYLQEHIALQGSELNPEWRAMLAASTFSLCRQFVENYPAVLEQARVQAGEPTTYPRRRAVDSRLDSGKSIAEQFDLLRIVDNDEYPALFELYGKRYILRIEKSEIA
jgi:UDP-2,4-diacetamido-2,4,6-trideoxy-beta-L-altropyranose hydrolase